MIGNVNKKNEAIVIGNVGKFSIGTMVTIQNESGTRHKGQVIKY